MVTVSRVLNEPDKVKPETRRRVEAAIARMGYMPNLLAGSLARNCSRVVGVVVPTITNSLFADTVQGMTDRLRAGQYQIMMGASDYSLEEEEALVQAFLGRRAEAIVLTGTTHTEVTRAWLKRAAIPVVEMWNLTDDPIDTVVGFSNFEAARRMTHFLAGRGYRTIGYIGGLTQDNDRTSQREAGYDAAMRELGRSVAPTHKEQAAFDIRQGGEALVRLLTAAPEVDAIFAASDVLAVGAIFECQRRGWAVPGRVAIAGLDDSIIAGTLVPSLTTVRIPRYDMGARIADTLLDRLSGTRTAGEVIDLGFEIIARESA